MNERDSYCDDCGVNLQHAGSHYHCGNCHAPKPTSMYGHWHSVHTVNGKSVKTEGHFSCEPGACEGARRE